MPYTFLITGPQIAQRALDRLAGAGCRILFVESGDGQTTMESAMRQESVDAVIWRELSLSRLVIDSCPTLRVISKHGVGVNNIDVAAATERGIPVFITPGVNAQSVVELTFGLLFSVARRIPVYDRSLRDGKWNRKNDGVELAGRTLGVVGIGNIGRRVARLGVEFGMRVLAYDPFVRSVPELPSIRVYSNLGQFLPQLDVLSLHCPLSPETENLIGVDQLRLLRKGAIVINTARAGVINYQGLAAALREGHLWGAGLDTFSCEREPPSAHLAGAPNVVFTPHIGGSTFEAVNAMSNMAVDTALNYLSGGAVDLPTCVNAEVLLKCESGNESAPRPLQPNF